MKKKNGFTLAEALITIGIIGVIAALTLPSLTYDIQKQKIGPTLAKAVNVLENANLELFRETESSNIESACMKNDGTEQEYFACLLEKTGLVATEEKETTAYKYKNTTNKYNCITTKDGISFCTNSKKTEDFLANKKYYGTAKDLVIDINGTSQKPNTFSKDAFEFKLDYQGQLIPVGGKEYNIYNKKPNDPIVWQVYCQTAKTIIDERSCTGSIVDNNWKVIYKL